MFPITCNAVGDIIALATFVLDIIRALDETRGSVPEYSDFVGELRAMHTMLVAVVRISQDTMDGVLRKEIVSEVDHCGKDVQRALARIVRFSALESAGARSSSMRVQLARQWYKLEWRFSQRGKSEVVRAELRAATQRLTTLLVISNADGAARFRNLLADQFRALVEREAANSCAMGGIRSSLCELQISSRRDHAFVDELFRSAPNGIDSRTVAVAVLCAAVCAMHGTNRTVPTALLLIAIYILSRSGMHHARALPKEVSYTEMNALTLLDALGRRMVLPLELCETYDIFHATLVNLFSKTNGRWFIDTYAYDLTDAHTDQCVLRDGPWGSIVRTGTKLEMSVIVHQVTSGRELPQCPWCLDPAFECTGRTAMKCRSCDRIFDVATKGTLSGPPDSRFELEYGKDGYDDIKGVKDYTYTHTGARVCQDEDSRSAAVY
ncbi:hypothetical protein PENSPDRAFT_204117 [Peniophora sp. CONT]|nr:hypothetical protein PENSPDRAFT_204117 [Peniophora sp. CONT]